MVPAMTQTPEPRTSGNELVSQDDIQQWERGLLSHLEESESDFYSIFRYEGWKVLGYDTCLAWWSDRIAPELNDCALTLTMNMVKRLRETVEADEESLPKAQRTPRRKLARLLGVAESTLRDQDSRSSSARNRAEDDLGKLTKQQEKSQKQLTQEKPDTSAQSEYQGKPEEIGRQLIREGVFSDEQIKQRSGLPKRKVEQLQKEWKEEQEAESKKLQAAQSDELAETETVDVGWREDDGRGHRTVYDAHGDELYTYPSWPMVDCNGKPRSETIVETVEAYVEHVTLMTDIEHECLSTDQAYDQDLDPGHPCKCSGYQLTAAQRERIVKAATAILDAVQKGK